ncbi:MAG: hypothetical protein JF593_05900 [Novosphingobium sp.]|nr:hypothetical protein [Novosphingobium sp.]
MKTGLRAGALALGIALLSTAALADDPHDPSMRSAAARARDHELIRRLNVAELDKVRRRDAGYADGWRAYREKGSAEDDYAAARSDYQRRMAAWRHAVAACEGGNFDYCQR